MSEHTTPTKMKSADVTASLTECKEENCNPLPCPGFIDLADFGLNDIPHDELIGKWAQS